MTTNPIRTVPTAEQRCRDDKAQHAKTPTTLRRLPPEADKLTPRQRNFVLNYLQNGCNAKQAAITAGYSKKAAKEVGCKLLTNANVAAFFTAMRDRMESAEILSIEQRKRILSEIASHDPADYIEAGADGIRPKFDKNSPNRRAVAGIKFQNTLSGKGKESAGIKELKLRDPVAAIAELNRMEGIGRESPAPNILALIKIDPRSMSDEELEKARNDFASLKSG